MRLSRFALLLLILAGCSAQPASIPPGEPLAQAVRPTAAATDPAPPANPSPTAVPPTPPPASPSPTAVPPTPAPSATPTPSGPVQPRVGIQVGHWRTEELPDELERFRTSTGAFVGGVSEVEVNLPVAERIKALLEAEGVAVDLLPATVPIAYQADAFISIHSDGSPSASPRGFKMATPWRTSRASQALYEALMAEYGAITGLPEDGAVTVNMRGYYAFSWTRRQHAIARTTPAVIVELGYLSNPADRAFLTERADLAAAGVANGVLRYLAERDPSDMAALQPPDLSIQRPRGDGATVHARPNADSEVIFTMTEDQSFMPFREENGWYEGIVRGGWRIVGWMRKEDLRPSGEAFPMPNDR